MKVRQSEIIERIRSNIPFEVWSQYSHLSLHQMAETSELSQWSEDLRAAANASSGFF